MTPNALDLDRERSLGQLLDATFRVFLRHSGVFFSVTLLATIPLILVVDGIWGGQLRDGGAADPSTAASLTSSLLSYFVVPALVTGLHVRIVQALGRGEEPTVPGAVRSALGVLPAAVAVVVLYTLAVAVGFVLLLVPGIYLAVRLYFGVQAAIVDGARGPDALHRSAALTDQRWWTTARRLVLSGILIGIFTTLPYWIIQRSVDAGWLRVSGQLVVSTISLSLSALFGTLLFFGLRVVKYSDKIA